MSFKKGEVKIYKATAGVVLEGMQKPAGHPCDAACRRANHKYRHEFAEPVEVVGLVDNKGQRVVLLRPGRKG